MSEERQPSAAQQVKRLYDDSESATAKAFEQLVARDSFGELLARVTENVVALTKIGSDTLDLVLRNLRLAGRQDIVRLSRQLARTEDKLELLLQEVERLRDEDSSRTDDDEDSSRTDEDEGSSRTDGASRGGSSSRRARNGARSQRSAGRSG